MGLRNTRWTIQLIVLGFWLLMMGLLVRREFGGRLEPTALGRLTTSTESWMGIFLGEGQRVGYVHVRQDPEERRDLAGIKMSLGARMTLNLLGKPTDLDLSGFVWKPYEEALADFEFVVRSAEYDFRIAGRVADGELAGEILSAGETIPLRVPVSDELVFSSGLGTALRFPSFEVGDEYRLDSFDPLTLRKSPVRVRCIARETLRVAGEVIDARVLALTSNGIRSRAWIDQSGEVVQARTPFGLVLRKISPEQAHRVDAGPEPDELLDFTAVRPTGRRPFRNALSLVVELAGVEDRELPQDQVQAALGGGRYRLRTSPEPPPGVEIAATAELARHLRADAFVQSDHPKIRRRAAEIVGDETDPWRRALRIYEWVFTSLEKEVVLSIPSALEVLENRRGDCNEHTVLFTALGRAAGLPTRIAIGLVWSDDLDGFYYHAWPEVHLGGWVWMDPTLGQPLADATHIKLLNGGIESWPQLVPFMGQLEVKVLEIR
ncbi:MAG: transglutaminase domain-containing protein [bacterium]|nr:transglutaminase domain-containing protein [bacterium]